MKLAREADIKFTLEQNKMEIEKCQVRLIFLFSLLYIILFYLLCTGFAKEIGLSL